MSTPDLSEFYKLSRPKKPPCQVGAAIPQLTSADQAALHAAVEVSREGHITAGAIEAWLAARGHKVTQSAIIAHRKGTCSCAD
jgi:hypothetical protein